MRNVWRGDFTGYWGVVMQDLGYELPRITIPRTPVNKGKKRIVCNPSPKTLAQATLLGGSACAPYLPR